MNSRNIRKIFKDFFEEKQHTIVPSAPMVVKDDPTLMFTNAGMNQFKDYFLGNLTPPHHRIANSQKCLRVSGKHNDLEEVGHDTYHHTMFEMLGNWSFGDYFKEKAIDWGWEFLTNRMGIDPSRLYATVFEGSPEEQIDRDEDAFTFWKKHLDDSRIINGSKKDNFWEMGDTGPCGPCSEIHVDIRSDDERKKIPGQELINTGHPLVIEIWNLVFIQYNRKTDGSLNSLPQKHVDTGLGFERLTMVVQGKKSNYDTDIFQPLINQIAALTHIPYGKAPETDIAMRVVSDHLRAIAFSIADGQLPSNTGAGYVIRRILRRATRYSFTFLGQKEPFMGSLLQVLTETMGDAYPELVAQKGLIVKVITEEENSFLKTLSTGISRLDDIIAKSTKQGEEKISGKAAFELYDTYGFPPDLTQLILHEKGFSMPMAEFEEEMAKQRNRSRKAAEQDTGDWHIVQAGNSIGFTGYDRLEQEVRILRFRQFVTKNKSQYQLVFDQTPFYAESGGQVSDRGYIQFLQQKMEIKEVRKENNIIIHITESLPEPVDQPLRAIVNGDVRLATMRNHSATHLLHFALRQLLGDHVEQKGSLVHPDYLRFDFSHFQKLEQAGLDQIERTVNGLIVRNIHLDELHDVPLAEARKMGAMALFGEKYGDHVRVIRFGESVELCGGTHVQATGEIGYFRIVSEGSIAAGIRRIEAISGLTAQELAAQQARELRTITDLLKSTLPVTEAVAQLIDENHRLTKEVESFAKEKAGEIKNRLKEAIEEVDGVHFIQQRIPLDDPALIRDLAFQLRGEVDSLILILGAIINGKPNLTLMISDDLVKSKNLDAGKIIRESAREMRGGGGGQPFFATAGGKDPAGLDKAMQKARQIIITK